VRSSYPICRLVTTMRALRPRSKSPFKGVAYSCGVPPGAHPSLRRFAVHLTRRKSAEPVFIDGRESARHPLVTGIPTFHLHSTQARASRWISGSPACCDDDAILSRLRADVRRIEDRRLSYNAGAAHLLRVYNGSLCPNGHLWPRRQRTPDGPPQSLHRYEAVNDALQRANCRLRGD
jgi:hypothetical protein